MNDKDWNVHTAGVVDLVNHPVCFCCCFGTEVVQMQSLWREECENILLDRTSTSNLCTKPCNHGAHVCRPAAQSSCHETIPSPSPFHLLVPKQNCVLKHNRAGEMATATGEQSAILLSFHVNHCLGHQW